MFTALQSKRCPQCGERLANDNAKVRPFVVNPWVKRFHSSIDSIRRRKMVEIFQARTCQHCGKSFTDERADECPYCGEDV